MTISQITEEVNKLEYQDLDKLQKTITYLKNRSIKVGSRISFSSSKSPYEINGMVTKINSKTFSMVTEDYKEWRVSKNLVRLEGK